MLQTVWAVVREGKIELVEKMPLQEGTKVLVTLMPDDDNQFWLTLSQSSLAHIWENDEDDVYAKLLEE